MTDVILAASYRHNSCYE